MRTSATKDRHPTRKHPKKKVTPKKTRHDVSTDFVPDENHPPPTAPLLVIRAVLDAEDEVLAPQPGFYQCTFPFLDCTDDLIAELNALIPAPPIWQQLEADWREIRVESLAGHPASIHYDTLEDVARAYDSQLQRTRSPWRLVFVEYPGSSSAGFFAVDQAGAARLVRDGFVAS